MYPRSTPLPLPPVMTLGEITIDLDNKSYISIFKNLKMHDTFV